MVQLQLKQKKRNTFEGIPSIPENFHRVEPFHLTFHLKKQQRVFGTNGKRSMPSYFLMCVNMMDLLANCELICSPWHSKLEVLNIQSDNLRLADLHSYLSSVRTTCELLIVKSSRHMYPLGAYFCPASPIMCPLCVRACVRDLIVILFSAVVSQDPGHGCR